MHYVDAHFHLWDLEENYYPWLTDRIASDHVAGDYSEIRRNYLLEDFFDDIKGTPVAKGVHIQADHDHGDPVRESRWLQSVANQPDSRGFPHAIIAHAKLEEPGVEKFLEGHLEYANIRGIRQVLPANFNTNQQLDRGFDLLGSYGLSFDLRLRHPDMAPAAKFAARHGKVQFIVTHLGYPVSHDPDYLQQWYAGMLLLARRENVAVKISGFGFIDPHWTADSIRSLILKTIDLFGVQRVMFASDFPVDKLSRDYISYWHAYEEITAGFSENERVAMFCENAERIYRI